MKRSKLLTLFFRLYLQIRSKSQRGAFIQWFCTIFIFLQLTSVALYRGKPEQLTQQRGESDFFMYLQSFLLGLPWVFATRTMLYETLVLLSAHLVMLLIFGIAARREHRKEHTDWWALIAIRVYQQSFSPLLVVPQCWRIMYLIGEAINQYDYWISVSLMFQLVCLAFLAWNHLLSSIFLDPIEIDYGGRLDVFDGKSCMHVFFARVLFVVLIIVTDLHKKYTTWICPGIGFLLFIVVFYYRGMNTIHVSWIGEYIEMAPLLCFPVVILVHEYASPLLEWRFLAVVVVNILVAVTCYFKRRFLVKKAVKMMSSFTVEGKEEAVTAFVTGMASVLRLFYLDYPNPFVVEKYMAMQKKMGLKASVLVELVRFLSVFPSKRETMYNEIVHQSSKSTPNSWMLYLLAKRLYGLTETTDAVQKELANKLYRGLLVSIHEYWVARHQRKWLSAMKYAMHATYYFIETKAEFQSLLYRYPFDPQVHAQMAEFNLSACGSYAMYKQHKTMADSLEHNKYAINDPILRKFFRARARILKYCNEEDSKSLNLSGQTSTNSSANSTYYQTAPTVGSKLELFGGNVATLIEESKKIIIIGFSRSFFFVAALVIGFVWLISPSINTLMDKCVALDDAVIQCSRRFYLSGSLLYFERMLNESGNYFDQQLDIETVCMMNWYLAPDIVSGYFSNLSLISTFGASLLNYYFDNPRGYPDDEGKFCPYVFFIMRWVFEEAGVQHKALVDELQVMYNGVDDIANHVEKGYMLYAYVMWVVVAFAIMEFFFYVILFICLNVRSRHHKRVRKFLTSKQRLALLLLERSEQSWELLRAFLPGSQIENEDIMKLNDPNGFPFDRKLEVPSKSSEALMSDPRLFGSGANFSMSSSYKSQVGESSPKSPDMTANEETEASELPAQNTESLATLPSNVMTLKRANSKKLTVSFVGSHTPVFGTQMHVIKGGRGRMSLQRTRSDHDILAGANGSKRDSCSEGSGRSASKYVTTQSTDPASEHDLVGATIGEVKSSEHCICLRIVMLLSGAAVLGLLLLISVLAPFYFRKSEELDLAHTMQEGSVMGRALFVIINALYTEILSDKDFDHAEFSAAVEFVRSESESPISKFMMKTQNFELKKTYATTVYSVLCEFNSSDWTQEHLWDYLAPIMIYFYDRALQMLYSNELHMMLTMRYSNDIAYILIIVLVIIFLLYICVSVEHLMRSAFNSLFHFPCEFVSEMMATKPEKEEKFPIPNKVLVVTMIEQSKEIYSVSDNSVDILRRLPSELICRKFSDLFEETENSLLAYTAPDQKKQFRYSISRAGELVKVMMIEEQFLPANNKTKNEQFITKLSLFVSQFCAREYVTSGRRQWTYENAVIILLRLRYDAPKDVADRFYKSIASKTQNYSSVECLKADGSTMMFAITDPLFQLLSFFFVRDLIVEANTAAKMKGSMFMPVSFVVTTVSSIEMNIVTEHLPFLSISYDNKREISYVSYSLANDTIGFVNCPFLEMLPVIETETVAMPRSPLRNGTIDVNIITFKAFLESMTRI